MPNSEPTDLATTRRNVLSTVAPCGGWKRLPGLSLVVHSGSEDGCGRRLHSREGDRLTRLDLTSAFVALRLSGSRRPFRAKRS
jgi:hypothetical protein